MKVAFLQSESGRMAPVEIRGAVVDDAAAIARVHVAAWRAGYAGLLPDDVLAGLSLADWTERRRRGLEDGDRVLVVADPEIAGFAAFGPCRDGEGGEVYAFYLDPARWRRGLGRALMAAAAAELDAEHHRSVLWVLRANARARGFYAATGWRPDGTEKVAPGPGGAVLDEVRYVRESLTPRSPGSPPAPGRNGPSAPPTPPGARAR